MSDPSKNINYYSDSLISIVIPVYNSERTIEIVIAQIIKALKDDLKYEIILVNDGSKDHSFKKCMELSQKYSFVKFINLSKNFGQHNAIMAGLHYVKGDYVVFMDDDLQTPAEAVLKLIKEIEKGYDVVFADYIQKQHNWFRRAGTRLKNWIVGITLSKPGNIRISNFFIIRKFLSDEMINYTGPYPFLSGLVLRATDNIGNIKIQHRKRLRGRSNYNLKKLLRLGLSLVTNFSVIPLRLSFFTGLFCSIVGLAFAIFFIIKKIIDPYVPLGWTSIIVAVLFFSGILLISIGLIGEYVGRIYISQNKRPQYVIKEKYNVNGDGN